MSIPKSALVDTQVKQIRPGHHVHGLGTIERVEPLPKIPKKPHTIKLYAAGVRHPYERKSSEVLQVVSQRMDIQPQKWQPVAENDSQ
jgi:hypothetical protein